ncbi:MAG: membrane protein insertase YidC [Candidatus Hydrogenedentes bacterium]|nr:membrane protein insertase YidC [Candidatus Hydrogenedentota bacterium]
MLDDDDDKGMKRNQLIAVVLLTAVMFVWFQWFLPKPPPQPDASTAPAKTGSAQEPPAEAPAGKPGALAPAGASLPKSDGTQWPFLPPVPETLDSATDEITLDNDNLRFVLTRIGARLKRATVLLGSNNESSIQLVPETEVVADTDEILPLGLRFTNEAIGDELDRRRWDLVSSNLDGPSKSVTFSITLPNVALIRKTFQLEAGRRVMSVSVEYQNLEAAPRVLGMDTTPAYYLNWGPNVTSHDETKGVLQAFLWHTAKENTSLLTSKLTGDNGAPLVKTVDNTDWMVLKSAYFMVAIKSGFERAQGWAAGTPKDFRFGLGVPREEIKPQESLRSSFDIYVGPSEMSSLKAAWPTLPQALRFFDMFEFMDWFAKLLLGLLNWFHNNMGVNYGVAIILLTILVRAAMIPLTLKSMKSMKKMQLLGPEMQQLKEKYKDDQQELSKKTMEMYRERGINPAGGCFPMLLQMPVFIALYTMLNSAFELRGAHFVWWITDLSQPDRLYQFPWALNLPLIGSLEYLNLLPILMGVVMVISQKFMPTSGPAMDPTQKTMMNIMPAIFSLMCYTMASGLSLYILTSTILGMLQQHFIRISDTELSEKKKPKKKQHFYAAAQAKKRQRVRELKDESRRLITDRTKGNVPGAKRADADETKTD